MEHVTVVAEDKTGLLSDISGLLGRSHINISDIQASVHADVAVIQLNVDRFEDALRTLTEENYHVVADDAILVRIADRPGALAVIARSLSDARIDIRSMTVAQRLNGHSLVSIQCCDNAAARECLRDVLVK